MGVSIYSCVGTCNYREASRQEVYENKMSLPGSVFGTDQLIIGGKGVGFSWKIFHLSFQLKISLQSEALNI